MGWVHWLWMHKGAGSSQQLELGQLVLSVACPQQTATSPFLYSHRHHPPHPADRSHELVQMPLGEASKLLVKCLVEVSTTPTSSTNIELSRNQPVHRP